MAERHSDTMPNRVVINGTVHIMTLFVVKSLDGDTIPAELILVREHEVGKLQEHMVVMTGYVPLCVLEPPPVDPKKKKKRN